MKTLHTSDILVKAPPDQMKEVIDNYALILLVHGPGSTIEFMKP